jgi:hypothetical protein
VEKYGRAGKATDEHLAVTHCTLNNTVKKYTHKMKHLLLLHFNDNGRTNALHYYVLQCVQKRMVRVKKLTRIIFLTLHG